MSPRIPKVPPLESPIHPPLPRRIRLKLRRIYRDLTGPRIERDWFRARRGVITIQGWLTPNQERWLFEAAYSLPDKSNIVEIGSFKGRSTCCLASACRGTRKRVYAVDTFRGNDSDFSYPEFLADFTQNMQRVGLSEYVQPIPGKSSQTARNWNKPIHMLFIDGSHEYADVLADFEGFFPHVVPGGIVAFHDVNEGWPGPLRVWNETAKRRLTATGFSDYLAFGRKPPEAQQ